MWMLMAAFFFASAYVTVRQSIKNLSVAEVAFFRALMAAPASVVMPFNFLQLPIAAVFGLVLFGEMSDLWTWAGAVVIFSSSYYIARRESRDARRIAAEIQSGLGSS